MDHAKLSRRDFLKFLGTSTAALTVPSLVFQACKREVEEVVEAKPVIWIQGQACSGCSISLLNNVDPGIPELITRYISLNFHQTLSTATGDTLIDILDETLEKGRKDYLLILEGSIPIEDPLYCTLGSHDGHHVPYSHWVKELSRNAEAIIAVGTCATYGGIPGGKGNKTGAIGSAEFLKDKTVVNVPGCPPHPDWMAGTFVHYLLHGLPELDTYGRPLLYFENTVHEKCERLDYYHRGRFAQFWGDEGCLYMLGCLGMDTNCDVPTRRWLGVNSCTGSGSGCIGCTEDVFPDTGDRGLYLHKVGSARQEHEKEEV